jgi:hypothetical protein
MELIKNEELTEMIKDGYFFNFCCGFALNKGFKDEIKEKKEVKFNVGDYNVTLIHEPLHFEICHKEYFARIIHAYYHGVEFIGDNEQEVIEELLTEFKKEI